MTDGQASGGLSLRFFFSREVLGVVSAIAGVVALAMLAYGALVRSGVWSGV
jgi:hypothetical protein